MAWTFPAKTQYLAPTMRFLSSAVRYPTPDMSSLPELPPQNGATEDSKDPEYMGGERKDGKRTRDAFTATLFIDGGRRAWIGER